MSQDWRTRLRRRPRVTALDRLQTRRHRELIADPIFVQGTDALMRQLERARGKNPDVVTDFFDRFSWPNASKLKSLNAFLRNVRDTALRKTLRQYVQHANRFRIVFTLRKHPPHFEAFELLPAAAKFHIKISKGQLTPTRPTYFNEPVDSSFEAEEIEVPQQLRKAIKCRQAKFVCIDDKEGSSCLSVLEHVAYFPEGITFVLHNAEQPYLLCLVGEKVSVELWRKLSTTVTGIFRKKFGRGKAGRPKDLSKLRKAKRLLKTPGPLKAKAFLLAGKAQNTETQQSYLSRLRKEQKR